MSAGMNAKICFPIIVCSLSFFGFLIFDAHRPRFDQIMQKCMAAENGSPPAQRTETCLCTIEEVSTLSWTAYKAFVPSGHYATAERAAMNICRAAAYSVSARHRV